MRKILFALVAMIATLGLFTSCDKNSESVIDFDKLPSTAQTMINTYFDKDNIMLIIYDSEIFDKDYVVTFFDGTIIDFAKDGSWESIESLSEGVPTAVIPEAIATYLSANYADRKVTEIEKETNGYDVKIDDMIELNFNLSGVLVGVDVD